MSLLLSSFVTFSGEGETFLVLLEGDQQSGTDRVLLEGDQQAGGDREALEGDQAV